MYWDPEVQLQLALRRQAELRCEAHRRPQARSTRLGNHRFSGLHLHIGTFIVAVGRTLCEEDAPRTRLLHP
jgi:hypothetical protein